MRIVLTGATGFVGRALVLRLLRDGHALTAFARNPARARSLLGADVSLVDTADSVAHDAAVSAADAVINLAGEPLVGPRWTEQRRIVLVQSRVATTRRLVEAMRRAPRRPRVLISASAVGYYGDRGDEALSETSTPGRDFAAQLCQAWEGAALEAAALGVRVLTPRIGIVLGDDGGVLARLLPLFGKGLGGRLGSGRQWMPWIHQGDLCELFVRGLDDDRLRGPVNAAAPAPVRNVELTAVLAAALARPAGFTVPAAALRVAMGDAATTVLASQRVEAKVLAEAGFHFQHPELAGALADLLAVPGVSFSTLTAEHPSPLLVPGSTYLRERRPTYLLRATATVAAPRDRVFDFFSRAENLGLMTPSAMGFTIESIPARVEAGATIDYHLRALGLPIGWRTSIEHWRPPEAFVDAQTRGPYRAWWHEHHFADAGDDTLMEDRVYYALPAGPFGRAAHGLVVRGELERIFRHRRHAMRLRFGLR